MKFVSSLATLASSPRLNGFYTVGNEKIRGSKAEDRIAAAAITVNTQTTGCHRGEAGRPSGKSKNRKHAATNTAATGSQFVIQAASTAPGKGVFLAYSA